MSTNDYSSFNLNANPFYILPPRNDNDIQRVFVGREEELASLSRLCSKPGGIFLCGLFGIGKSILVREFFRRNRSEIIRTIYVKYNKMRGFSGSILPDLAMICAQKDLKITYDILSRQADKPQKTTTRDIERAVEQVVNPLYCINRLTKEFSLDQVYVCVDDLDKDTELRDIDNVIMETRQLIEMGFRIILPGHSIGVTERLSSSADILLPLSIETMQEDEYLEMLRKYLALARISETVNLPYHPFSEDAGKLVAQAICETKLTPRLFNFTCSILLEDAARRNLSQIDKNFLIIEWDRVVKDFLSRSLKPQDRRRLEILYRDEGILSEDTRGKIKELTGSLGEYQEAKDLFRSMIIKNILIETTDVNGKPGIGRNSILDYDFGDLVR